MTYGLARIYNPSQTTFYNTIRAIIGAKQEQSRGNQNGSGNDKLISNEVGTNLEESTLGPSQADNATLD